MIRFLVDEDLPRSLVQALKDVGFAAEHVLDVDLRGRPDREVLDGAIMRGAVLVSGDVGFANLLGFPLGTHRGIVVVRFPNEASNQVLNRTVVDGLRELAEDDLAGSLVIIEPKRLRIRRPGPSRKPPSLRRSSAFRRRDVAADGPALMFGIRASWGARPSRKRKPAGR